MIFVLFCKPQNGGCSRPDLHEDAGGGQEAIYPLKGEGTGIPFRLFIEY